LLISSDNTAMNAEACTVKSPFSPRIHAGEAFFDGTVAFPGLACCPGRRAEKFAYPRYDCGVCDVPAAARPEKDCEDSSILGSLVGVA
jgi:hypothetical protein